MNNEYSKVILIACSMIEDEIRQAFADNPGDEFAEKIEVWWQERGHHAYPDRLRDVIQREIDKAERAGADLILLAYGLCGNGAVGWKTRSAVLAMPRFDDCINMMLCTGVRDRRNYEQAGVMYMTGGWTRDDGAMLSMRDNYIAKYGRKKGLRVTKLMFDSYKRVSVIDTGCYELESVIKYAGECADLFGLGKEIIRGGYDSISKLITGSWDDDILVKKPGEAVLAEDFDYD